QRENCWTMEFLSQRAHELLIANGLGSHGVHRSAQAVVLQGEQRHANHIVKAIQLQNCFPQPMRPPSPSRNGNSNGLSAPPSRASTTPMRRFTTRSPASLAGVVAASHCRLTSARNPLPEELCSVSSSSPRFP